jgi:hypothetical protein
MFIHTAEPFVTGTRLWLSIEVRGEALPFGEVEVVWHRHGRDAFMRGGSPGFGVRFADIPERARALVEHLLFICAPRRPVPAAAAPRKEHQIPPGLTPRRRAGDV